MVALASAYAIHRRRVEAAQDRYFDVRPLLTLRVPHLRAPIVIDGDSTEMGWQEAIAGTGAFVDPSGAASRPYSDVRLTWDEETLFVLLYAGDENLQALHTLPDSQVWLEDSFHLFFGNGQHEIVMDISPRGIVADGRRPVAGSQQLAFDSTWSSEVRLGVDLDGTLNDASDVDEAWVVEAAIPLRSLGLEGKPGERLLFHADRCDVPKNGRRVCASFGEGASEGLLVLDR